MLLVGLFAAAGCVDERDPRDWATAPGKAAAPAAQPLAAPTQPAQPAQPAQPSPPAPPASGAVSPPADPPFRIADAESHARIDRAAPLGVRVESDASEDVAIDLASGARLELGPGGKLLLLRGSPSAVLLIAGNLHVQLLPQGRPTGQPLRLVTRDFAVTVSTSAELWLARGSKRDAGPCVAVLAGSVAVERLADAEGDDALRSQPLAAGHLLAPGALEATSGPRTLDRAQLKRVCTPGKPAAREEARTRAAPLARLEAALATFEQAEARARTLLLEQRDAKARGDGLAVHAQQRELVQLAQRKLERRRQVRLTYELACAQLTSAGDRAGTEDFERRFAARAQAVLGAF